MSKKYGLILSGRKKGAEPPKADFTKKSVFGSDDDSEEGPAKPVPTSPGANEKRQARRLQEKALEEDPTIFQYDELYDDIELKRTEEKSKNKETRKPKYINRLLECAERRKLENERRLERMVQKEREKEGEQFADKESFVTGAYRKKLEELRKAEEREQREDYLEAIGDVTKQQDLGGFYRHLYEQKLKIKEGIEDVEEIKDPSGSTPGCVEKEKSSIKPRTYRKRHSSDDNEDNGEAIIKDSISKKAHIQSNIDADSDFSIDESSTDDECGPSKEQPTETLPSSKNAVASPISNRDVEEIETIKELSNGAIKEECGEISSNDEEKEKVALKPVKKEKKDIWKKRTVGDVFDAALRKYYERKAARSG